MRYTSKVLQNNNFKLLSRIDYSNGLDKFVKEQLYNFNFIIILYWISRLGVIIILVNLYRNSSENLDTLFFTYLSIGILVGVLLIPIHELIHAFAYKMLGTPIVKFNIQIRRFKFTVHPSDFIISIKEYTFVALSPFVVLSIILIVLMYLYASYLPIWLGAMVLHLLICGGDFAVVGYIQSQFDINTLVYDDFDSKQVLFYNNDKGELT